MSDELAAQAHALLERLFALLPDCRAVVPQLEAVAHRPGAVSAQAERLLYFALVGEALSVAEAAGRLNIALATFYASGLGNDERAINGALVARLLAVTSTSDLEHLSNPETTAIEVENIAGLIGRYSERYLNGLWEALTKLLVKWTRHLRPGQPAPPATNVIILNERVRQRQLAAMEVPRHVEA